MADERRADLAGGPGHRQPAVRPRARRARRALLARRSRVQRRARARPGRASRCRRGAAELLRTDDADDIYYQVLRRRAASADRRRPRSAGAAGGARRARRGALSRRHRRTTSRCASPTCGCRASPGGAGSGAPLVQVAETLDKRSRLATEIIKGVILPQFVILPLAVLLVWFALARGIAPLNELQQRIRRRDSDDLSPIDEREVPEEVAPLVRAINDLLARLDQSIRAQKHFLADAAHQLKTPLAGLRTQAELAQREIDAGQHDPAALKRVAAADRALEPERRAHGQPAAGDGARRGRGARRAPAERSTWPRWRPRRCATSCRARWSKRIDLGYEGPPGSEGTATPPGPRSSASALLLRELIRNLVDNALQYTPRRRHGHGARGRRPVRPGRRAAGRGLRPRHRGGRARAGVPALLPLARHQRRRLRPRPGDRARDRDPARRRDHARRRRRAGAASHAGAAGEARPRRPLHRALPRRPGLSSAPAAGSSRSTSACPGPGRA